MEPLLQSIQGSSHGYSGHPSRAVLTELATKDPGMRSTMHAKGKRSSNPHGVSSGLNTHFTDTFPFQLLTGRSKATQTPDPGIVRIDEGNLFIEFGRRWVRQNEQKASELRLD